MHPDEVKTAVIAKLNDDMRARLLTGLNKNDKALLTRGVSKLEPELMSRLIEGVAKFGNFDPANDPYGEHDFGSVKVDETEVFWKIDYYDLSMTNGSPDPSNNEVTMRVLVIMLPFEY